MEVTAMTKLNSTARKIDTFFKVFTTLLNVAGIAMLVGLVIIGAALLFNLDPAMVGSGYNTVSLGFLELQIADAYAPDVRHVLILAAVQMVLAFVVCFVTRLCVNCIRQILRPMVESKPFDSTISTNLKKMAKYSLILGITVNLIQAFATAVLVFGYDLHLLLLSEKIPHLEFHFSFDLTFLLAAAVFLLMSYVFRYGEELQQLSDETL